MRIYILTTLSYIVPSMILGLVWHLVIFVDLYHRLEIYNRPEPIIPLGFASMIVQGIVMAYLYPFYAKGSSTVAKALTFSLTMGVFLFSISTLANAAKINVTSITDWLLIQSAFHLIQFLVTGGLIGLVYRNNVE